MRKLTLTIQKLLISGASDLIEKLYLNYGAEIGYETVAEAGHCMVSTFFLSILSYYSQNCSWHALPAECFLIILSVHSANHSAGNLAGNSNRPKLYHHGAPS